MQEKIYQQEWIDLPRDIREHLVKVFGIVKTGIAEIRDQMVISDGVTINDLKAITPEKMSEYVGSVESFSKLWQLTVSKANYELHPPIEIKLENMREVSNGEFNKITNPSQPIEINGSVKNKFCDSCDSKGGRHLKVCPKYK